MISGGYDSGMETNTTITQFTVGETINTRSLADYDCIFTFTVVKRTEKTVTINYHGTESRCKIRVRDGHETCKPFGSYSLAPTAVAGKRI